MPSMGVSRGKIIVDLVGTTAKGLRLDLNKKTNTVFVSVSIDSSSADDSNARFRFRPIRLSVHPSVYV